MNLALLMMSSWFMCGLIWLIQLVHYPSFHYIDKNIFAEFNLFHQAKISLVVMIMMLIELVCATLAIYYGWGQKLFFVMSVGILLLTLALWFITVFYFVPLHKKLARRGKNTQTIKYLVNLNWIRTVVWSVKAVLVTVMLFQFTGALLS